jgi:hypothetical protein
MKKQIEEIAYSNETYKNVSLIGEKYNLMLDSQDELAAEVQDIIMGFKPAKDLQEDIKNRLEINDELSKKIVQDINELILKPIQKQIQAEQNMPEEITTPPEPLINPTLEQAGQFTIEKPAPPSSSPLYNDTKLNREEILKEIEDVQHSSLVDHLLTTPVQNNQKVEEKKIIAEEKKIIVDKKQNQQPKPYTTDPYREPLA